MTAKEATLYRCEGCERVFTTQLEADGHYVMTHRAGTPDFGRHWHSIVVHVFFDPIVKETPKP